MRLGSLLIAFLGFPGWALSAPLENAPMGPKADESYLRLQFERFQAQAREAEKVRDAKRKEFLDLAHVGGEGDSCLAYANETGRCSISAAEFDKGLASHFPDSLEFQSPESLARKARKARQSVFEQLLDRAFLDGYRREDSLRMNESGVRKNPAESGGGFDGYDLPTLLKAFPRIRARVFAASDSAWLASRLENARGGLLPVTIAAWELPDTAIRILFRLPPDGWTPILKVPFGYITCSWIDGLPAPGMLAKIRTRLDQTGPGSGLPSRAQAKEFLRKRGETCRDEDTLGLSLRLAPPLRRQEQEPGPAWMSVHSDALPASIKSRIWARTKRAVPDTLGPIRGDYGIWTLASSSREIKPGRMLDSTACMARADALRRKAEYAERIRLEWEMIISKADSDRNGEARTSLFERLSKQGGEPDSAYQRMRERWVSGSLRFTRDMGFPDAASGTENVNPE